MSHKLHLAVVLSLAATSAFAQEIKTYDNGRKWSMLLDRKIGQTLLSRANGQKTASAANAANAESISAKVVVSDAAKVEAFVKEAGYEAETISGELVIVTIPASFISELATLEEVRYVDADRQLYPQLSTARTLAHVDSVTAGIGLDTPYDGTGVVLGVIDSGFQYSHPAFAGRVAKYGTSEKSGTLSSTRPADQKDSSGGHGTSVASIAGGAKVGNLDYHGIATGADLVLMKSDLSENAVLSQAKAIKTYAESVGKPWVTNMSFGAMIGSHDGSTAFDQSMESLTGKGAIFVASAGNEGGVNYHATYTFTEDNQTVYLYPKPKTEGIDEWVYTEVWGMATDGKAHLDIKPVIYSNRQVYEPESNVVSYEKSSTYFACDEEIDTYNKRQHAIMLGCGSGMRAYLNLPSTLRGYKVLWKITGNKGDTFHAWGDSNSYVTTFEALAMSTLGTALQGDDKYTLCESSSTIPSAVSVASHNNKSTSFKSLTGDRLSYVSLGDAEGLSTFSSVGPLLNDLPKPTITATGGNIISAASNSTSGFSSSDNSLVAKTTYANKVHYYHSGNGTSFSSPLVAGVIALWLQANPELTPADIVTILKETGRQDKHTGTAGNGNWNAEWGYGKIDAYEGLKKALAIKSAIYETVNSEAPVTLSKEEGRWRVLFNSNEGYADIQICSTDGKVVQTAHLDRPRCGQEHVISLSGYTPGVYVFRVTTPQSSLTRKLMVK